jgi:hypothetical protein
MNAIVETLRPRKTKPPLEIQIEAFKRQVRSLKAELKEERRHSVHMLGIMRSMSTPSARPCMCERCTCTPARAEMLRRR